jgi:hypothetical protein
MTKLLLIKSLLSLRPYTNRVLNFIQLWDVREAFSNILLTVAGKIAPYRAVNALLLFYRCAEVTQAVSALPWITASSQ